jgi:hypothetical protein
MTTVYNEILDVTHEVGFSHDIMNIPKNRGRIIDGRKALLRFNLIFLAPLDRAAEVG